MAILLLSTLISLIAILIPLIFGMIRCCKYLLNGATKVVVIDTYATQYNAILDVSEAQTIERPNIKKWDYAEIIAMGIAPIMGVILHFVFTDMKIPFAPQYAISAISFIAIGYCSYWLSRGFKNRLSLIANLILPYGIVIGVLSYIMLFVHFMSLTTLLAMGFVSIIAFPLIAPLPAIIYALRQLKIQVEYLQKQMGEGFQTSNWIKGLRWNFDFINLLYLIGFVSIIQIFLMILGQPLDGFWLAFRESEGFLFSIKDLDL